MMPHVAHTELMVFVVTAACSHVENGANMQSETRSINTVIELTWAYIHGVSLELTCAGLHALRPSVISVHAACTSALLEPSTTGSATTDLARFLEGAAL